MPQPADQVPRDPKCLPGGHAGSVLHPAFLAGQDRRRALVFALLTAVLWGTAYVAAKYALQTLGPFTAAAGRFVLGSALLWPLLLVLPRWVSFAPGQRPGVGPRGERRPAHAGVARITPGRGLQSRRRPSRPGGPSLTARTGRWPGTRPRPTRGDRAQRVECRDLPLIVAIGLFQVTFYFALQYVGMRYTTAANTALIVNTLLKRMLGRFARLLTAAYTTTAGAVGLLILAVIEIAQGGSTAGSPLSWGAVVFMAVFNTVIPYLLWYSALSQLSTTETTVFLYLTPLISVLLSAALLGEPVGVGLLIGGALILIGAYHTVSAGRAQPETLEG